MLPSFKKRERLKKLKILFEKIKKQIKEKYKYCNLYIKNLPDDCDDNQLRSLFSKYGQIRSCKTMKKELVQSYIGIKRSVRVYGFVCFYEASQAREAKQSLHNQSVFQNLGKLFVDYHQTKQERMEYLKLKMLSHKNFQKGNYVESPFPKMMGQFGNQGLRNFPVFNPNMLRKFPAQTAFMKPPMMEGNYMNQQQFYQQQQQQMNPLNDLDPDSKKNFFGDSLYQKISSNPNYSGFSNLHNKIIGIFLELEEKYVLRLLNDDNYFDVQVKETLRQLNEKIQNA